MTTYVNVLLHTLLKINSTSLYYFPALIKLRLFLQPTSNVTMPMKNSAIVAKVTLVPEHTSTKMKLSAKRIWRHSFVVLKQSPVSTCLEHAITDDQFLTIISSIFRFHPFHRIFCHQIDSLGTAQSFGKSSKQWRLMRSFEED